MTELSMHVTKGFVKRTAAIVLAVCLGMTGISAGVFADDVHAQTAGGSDAQEYYAPDTYDPYTPGHPSDPGNKDPYEPGSDSYDPYQPAKDYYDPSNAEGYYAPTGIEVAPSQMTLQEGEQAALTAKVIAPEGSVVPVKITWNTGNAATAVVDAQGTVTAVAKGTTMITATAEGFGFFNAAIVNVEKKTERAPQIVIPATGLRLDRQKLTFDTIGATAAVIATVTPFNSTQKDVTWTSSNPDVAAVQAGTVTATGNGTAVITAQAGELTAEVNVTVSQKSRKVAITLGGQTLKGTLKAKVGRKYSLKAVVTPENTAKANAKVKWKTSNKRIAAISSKGNLTVKKTGKVTVTAVTADGKKTSVTFRTSDSPIPVTKVAVTGKKTMKVKKSQTLQVSVTPATADQTNVTWTTSDKKIATVNTKGKVTAKKKGTVTIRAAAKDGSGKVAAFKIKIK